MLTNTFTSIGKILKGKKKQKQNTNNILGNSRFVHSRLYESNFDRLKGEVLVNQQAVA